MSTTDSTTTATWQSDSASDLSRSERGLISSHWSEVTAHLVPPGVAWRWGECQVSHRLKYNWKEAGLITRAPDGWRWMTTETLWLHVIEKAGNDEPVGVEVHGQEVLPVDADRSPESRVLVDSTPHPTNPDRQETLTGDTVDPRDDHREWDEVVMENRLKDPTRKSSREKAAAKPGQTRLTTFEDYNLDSWDVTTPWFRGRAVTTATGAVY